MSFPTGLFANKLRIASTIGVTDWFSANTHTTEGIVSVGTKAELINGNFF